MDSPSSDPLWAVPPHILVQAEAWNASHPGYTTVLPAELETKEPNL